MTLRVLVAPSGFKESLTVTEVAACIADGVRAALPDAEVVQAPLVDGGEGFARVLTEMTGGALHPVRVTGPVGAPVEAHFGVLGTPPDGGPRTAAVEMAAAAGLRLVPRDARDPRRTTSYGVGELIRAALDAGAARILVGCGDSGINDGGAGMAQALGARLLDAGGREIGRGGAELARLARIDLSGLDPRLARVRLDAAVNWRNALLGPRGVARVFGPQKGATPEMVEELEGALETYAAAIRRDLGLDVAAEPGAGASGGLGAGLRALLGARLHPRYDLIMRYYDLDRLMEGADLVLTAEGSLDAQTPEGKIPAEVARRAKRHGVPVIALAGTLGRGASANLRHGIDAYFGIIRRPCSLQDCFDEAAGLLAHSAEQAVRAVVAARAVWTRHGAAAHAARAA